MEILAINNLREMYNWLHLKNKRLYRRTSFGKITWTVGYENGKSSNIDAILIAIDDRVKIPLYTFPELNIKPKLPKAQVIHEDFKVTTKCDENTFVNLYTFIADDKPFQFIRMISPSLFNGFKWKAELDGKEDDLQGMFQAIKAAYIKDQPIRNTEHDTKQDELIDEPKHSFISNDWNHELKNGLQSVDCLINNTRNTTITSQPCGQYIPVTIDQLNEMVESNKEAQRIYNAASWVISSGSSVNISINGVRPYYARNKNKVAAGDTFIECVEELQRISKD